jgi:hypothetical protein
MHRMDMMQTGSATKNHGFGGHVLQSDEVLGRGDGGGGAADVRGKGDAEEERFGHVGVGGEVSEDGLDVH